MSNHLEKPQLSVVMCVHNEQERLEASIDSVLSQTGPKLELVIVNDGSSDDSERIIRSYSERDHRVRLINQSNSGLTKALINGCSQVTANYIARQDAGDISLPGRFKSQLELFTNNPSCVLASTGTVSMTPDGETFNPIQLSKSQAKEGLRQWTLSTIKGPPHHGSTMFRRDIYERVGGYRAEFSVAQDIDLWTRMIEHGEHCSVFDIYYQAASDSGSISHLRRNEQLKAAQVIFDCCRARAKTGDDSHVISSMSSQVQAVTGLTKSNADIQSDFFYFIASSLAKSNPEASKKYLTKAIKAKPTNWKALAKWVLRK